MTCIACITYIWHTLKLIGKIILVKIIEKTKFVTKYKIIIIIEIIWNWDYEDFEKKIY